MKALRRFLFLATILSCVVLSGSMAYAAAVTINGVAISSQALQTTPTDDGDDDGGPCAAAAVLGADDAQLDTLRAFRDTVLAKSPAGQQLIKIYYAKSAAIIAAIEKNPALKGYAAAALQAVLPAVDVFVDK